MEYNEFPVPKNAMATNAGVVVSTCIIVALASMLGCDGIGGRTITVEFRNAERVRGGEAVYLAGVKVGRVSDEPYSINGRARVPVLIGRKNKNGVPAGTVFLLKADPSEPQKQCLIAYSLGSGSPPPDSSKDLYFGVSNRAELLLMLGSEKASKIWGEITK